jgi:hypothetical protein
MGKNLEVLIDPFYAKRQPDQFLEDWLGKMAKADEAAKAAGKILRHIF